MLQWVAIKDGFVAACEPSRRYLFAVLPEMTPIRTGRYLAAFVEVSSSPLPNGGTNVLKSWSPPGSYVTAQDAIEILNWTSTHTDLDDLIERLEPMY